MPPSSHQVHQPLIADLRVQPLHKLRPLGCNAPVALAGLTAAAQVAAQSKKRRRTDVHCVRTQCNGLDHIGAGADAASHHDGHVVPDTLVPEPLVHAGKGKLNGNAHIVPDPGGCSAGAAPEAVNGDDVRTAAGNAAGNGGNIVNGGNLHDHRLGVAGRLLQRVYQLPQILDGVDVVVGRRRNGVAAHGHHTGLCHIPHDLCTGQVSPDAGLCTLSHLDLDGSAAFQIALVDAESAGCHLHDGVCPVLDEILVESPLAGVVQDPQLLCRPGKGCMGVVADGAVAHGGEHDGHGQLDLGGQVIHQLPLFVPLHPGGLCP